jgi:hypothetical protein
MTEHREHVLRIERTVDAPVDRVFEAWTSEEVLRRWLHDHPDWETPTAEVDLRVGGRIRVVMARSLRQIRAGCRWRVHGGRAAPPAGAYVGLGPRAGQCTADRARVHRARGRDVGADDPTAPSPRTTGSRTRRGMEQVLRQSRARAGNAVLLITVAAACWLLTADRMRGMDMGLGTDLGSLAWFTGVWVVMMAATR